MKTLLTITLLLSFTLAYSQALIYSYDASGNRISRLYIVFRKKSELAEEKKDTAVQSSFQVKAYPNPFSEQVTIEIESEKVLKESYSVLLFNELGQIN